MLAPIEALNYTRLVKIVNSYFGVEIMWFKIENKRSSTGQRYKICAAAEIAGTTVTEERSVQGVTAARKAAELVATTLNATATVYGADSGGEFVYGLFEIEECAANSSSPLIRKLFAESAAASLSFKDQLLADIPEQTIRGFASLAASLGYIVAQHKQIKRPSRSQIGYATLFRVFCGPEDSTTLTLPANDAAIALLTTKLCDMPGWTCVSEISSPGMADRKAIVMGTSSAKVTLNIDGELKVLRPRTVFRGTVPANGSQFMMIAQATERSYGNAKLESICLVYREADEKAVVDLVTQLLLDCNPFKNRVVLINRDLRTVRSRMSDRNWNNIIPHDQARAELDFIAASIRDREMLKAEGLTIRRGLLLSGPPGDGKSTAIECFINSIAGEATIIVVESIDQIRFVYHLAQQLAPAVVILEDLDLITKNRDNPYASVSKDSVTGELLQVLSGGSAYADIITIATTNHPEAIDEALSKRAGRFDAHIRMGYPSDMDKQRILDLYLDRFEILDEFTRHRIQQLLTRELGRLHLVPAHIEEFVKAGVKRARLARRAAEFADFESGVEAIKSIAIAKPAA